MSSTTIKIASSVSYCFFFFNPDNFFSGTEGISESRVKVAIAVRPEVLGGDLDVASRHRENAKN